MKISEYFKNLLSIKIQIMNSGYANKNYTLS